MSARTLKIMIIRSTCTPFTIKSAWEIRYLLFAMKNIFWWRIMLDFSILYNNAKIDIAKNAKIPALIAGNAPSLAQIDYSRIPKKYDAFRCNQFYFEEKYYLGKNVKVACFADQALFEQIYTMCLLNAKGEYKIEHIFLNNKRDFGGESAHYERNMQVLLRSFTQNIFINRLYDSAYSQHIAEFLEFLTLNQLYNYKHPTTGILLCAIATAMGYKDIYIAGIDFYRGTKAYAFDTLSQNLLRFDKFMAGFIRGFRGLENKDENYHSKDFDLACLEFLAKKYNVKFYSICPNSPLSNYIPLAKIAESSLDSAPFAQPKSKEYIKDIILPPKEAYMQFLAPDYKERFDYARNPTRIKRNIYFKALQDARRFCGDFMAFFKFRKEQKELK